MCVKDAPSELHSVLLSNRANALLALQKWSEAETSTINYYYYYY